ncbi:MAG: hypothetical protein N4A35_00070 [Flavobacteriales bacterium]|jgi:hypothetical protein|nr:hypothetical protein [Flavobacteriales bacterium]
MDVREQLLFEFSKSNAELIVRKIGQDQVKIEELVQLFLGSDQKLALRASMVLARIMDQRPYLMEDYIDQFVKVFLEKDTAVAVVRMIARFFQSYTLPEEYQGVVLDRSYELLINSDQPIAVRAFAMGTIEKISKEYEDLKSEFKLVLEDLYTEGARGLENKRRNILKTL